MQRSERCVFQYKLRYFSLMCSLQRSVMRNRRILLTLAAAHTVAFFFFTHFSVFAVPDREACQLNKFSVTVQNGLGGTELLLKAPVSDFMFSG